MLYRVQRTLDVGKGNRLYPGDVTALGWLDGEQVGRLLARGAVSELAAPPLAVLRGWKTRAGRLAEKAGIVDAAQFLEADTARIIEAMRAEPDPVRWRAARVERWKEEVMESLVIGRPRRRG